jgi:hypothetical protein
LIGGQLEVEHVRFQVINLDDAGSYHRAEVASSHLIERER